MNSARLLEIFDTAHTRAESTVYPTMGWFEKLPDCFYYRFRVETRDLTPFQKYYHEGKYIASIFDFTVEEHDEISSITEMPPGRCSGFHIAANTLIFPHIDNSPKRSTKTTILTLTGADSVLYLYNAQGDIIFELTDIPIQYTLYPNKVIHSYRVHNEASKLINIWHE